MRRKFIFSLGEFYHIYNRGTDKRIIFDDAHDYNRFILLLHLCNGEKALNLSQLFKKGRSFFDLTNEDMGEKLVDIGAYCLMPNHFHILIKEKKEDGISIFMKKLTTAYSMYFNSKKQRIGSLFSGRFKAEHVVSDNHLKYLFSYIHLNPVKMFDPKWKEDGIKDFEGAKKYLGDYKYSSYGIYAYEDKDFILTRSVFPEYFSSFVDFQSYLDQWLNFQKKDGPFSE